MSTHSAECSPHTCSRIETLRRAPSMNAACGWTLIRKTSLLRKINPMMRRSSFTKKDIYKLNHLAMIERRNVLEIMTGIPANCFAGSKLGSISSLRCQKSRTRILKDTTCEVMFRGRYERGNVVVSNQPSGGARRDRTDDLMLAKHALSQLSYGPVPEDECFTSIIETPYARSRWWAWEDLNFRPHAYQARALTN
jgi:hypothetical protein